VAASPRHNNNTNNNAGRNNDEESHVKIMSLPSSSRSAYLSRLRRAFLLRVHPDRFRQHPHQVRQRQAALVKALTDRFSQRDFAAWQQQQQQFPYTSNNVVGEGSTTFPYVVERRDGSLLRTKLRLDAPVERILRDIVDALRSSGNATSSLLRIPASTDSNHRYSASESGYGDGGVNGSASSSSSSFRRPRQYPHRGEGIDHRFDVRSNLGRDLGKFLSSMWASDAAAGEDRDGEIRRRRMFRMDAQAAAMEVRKTFGFQMVDATSLGWSSSSVAVLLKRLLAFHEEHASKLQIASYYPAHLKITSDEFRETLDLYGGVLRISPSMTPLQWLDHFRTVTPEHLEIIKRNRATLHDMAKSVQGTMGVRLMKGHSCPSYEYFAFVKRLYETSSDDETSASRHSVASTDDDGTLTVATTAVTIEPITMTVESPQACRRPIVTSDGTIRLGTGIAAYEVSRAVDRLGNDAREKASEHRREQELCKEAVERVQWQLGVQRVYRTNAGTVDNLQFLQSVSRILQASERQQILKAGLAGNSLGIASSGHFCHLADDGSIVIPHDWR